MKRVPAAEAALFERYATHADGSRVVQSSAPETIQGSLELAELRPGQRVLEIGTGSGYSTARLARAVGPTGQVVSVDVNPNLVERARRLLRADRFDQVKLVCQDAREELPVGPAFDRVLAWAAAPGVPDRWLERTRRGGRLVLPVAIARVFGATAVARVCWTGDEPLVERLVPAGYVPLHGATLSGVADPREYAEVTWRAGPRDDWTHVAWISAAWLRDASAPVRARVRRLGRQLRPGVPLLASEEAHAFASFVLTQRPDGVNLYVPGVGRAAGVGSPAGLAVVVLATGATWTAGEGGALGDAGQAWRAAGCPDLSDFSIRLHRTVGYWEVRLSPG